MVRDGGGSKVGGRGRAWLACITQSVSVPSAEEAAHNAHRPPSTADGLRARAQPVVAAIGDPVRGGLDSGETKRRSRRGGLRSSLSATAGVASCCCRGGNAMVDEAPGSEAREARVLLILSLVAFGTLPSLVMLATGEDCFSWV